MAAEYTEFVTDFPANSLRIGLDFVRGNNPGTRSLALAALSIESYALNTFLPPGETPASFKKAMSALPAPSQAQATLAFENLLPDASGTMKAADPAAQKVDWLTVLRTLLPLLITII